MKKFRKPILVLILALLAVMTFAACNNKVELKISFIVDEEVYHTINTNGEEALKLPSDPEKEGYVFDGWFWDRDSWQKPFTANSLSNEPLSENRSVYAKWNDSNAVEGTQAKFDGFNETNASTYSIIVSNATELLNFSDVVEINNKSSWKLTTDIQGNNAIASKIATLTAGDNTYYVLVTADNGNVKLYTLQIRRKPLYLVSFNTSGGSTVASQTVEEGDFATEPTATRIGYNFVNWNFDFGNTPITSSMTIVADWAVQVYTITYRDVGDIAFSGTHGQGYPATHIFDTITQLVSPQKTGYIFDGWFISDDGNEMALTQLPPTDYTSDITLYAKWRSVPYIDENGESQLVSVSNLTELTISGNRTLTGWYLLSGTVSGNFTLTVSGEAHIILADNCEWVVNAGIIVTTGNELYIYAQSVGSTAGELSTNANIGGGNGYDSGEKGGDGGTITINGGTISATNIGGGNGRNGGSVLVIGPGGGEVDYAAGNGGDNGTITINGGTVSATNIGGGNGGNGGYFLPSGNVG
ncbi:MAG: InlB B-repeat-containing protein, partial [Christensenellales bacterium]